MCAVEGEIDVGFMRVYNQLSTDKIDFFAKEVKFTPSSELFSSSRLNP